MANKSDQSSNIKFIQQYSYDRNEKLGQGSFGTVYLGHSTHDASKVYAIKVIPITLIQNDPELQENLFNEMKVMMLLSHENIIRCYDVLSTVNNHYFIMEYCSGGTLTQYLKKFGRLSEQEALQIIIQLLKGYYEMLKLGIIHRDLKPDNILIHEGVFKLADFGFAKCLENFKNDVLKSLVGTPLYMSPQILQGQDYNTKTDLWSFAMIYYEMLCGKTPWTAKFHVELINKILTQPIIIPMDVKVSEESRKFIYGALKVDENQRFSWEEVFCHELFQDAFDYKAKKKMLKQQALTYQALLKERIIELNIDLYKLFSAIDKNKNNQLEINEFAQLLKILDRKASREQIEFVFNSIDEDGNNVISLYEFRKWLTNSNISSKPTFQKKNSLLYYKNDFSPKPIQNNIQYIPYKSPTHFINTPKIWQQPAFIPRPSLGPPMIPPKPMNAPLNPNLPLRYSGGPLIHHNPPPFPPQFMHQNLGYGNFNH